MPYAGMPDYRDSSRWLKCRNLAEQAMLAEGWNRHAKKFHTVQMRRAVQLYKKG